MTIAGAVLHGAGPVVKSIGVRDGTLASVVPPPLIYGRVVGDRPAIILAIALMAVHTGLIAYSATRHSPTLDEPGHLIAGLSHWEFGSFEVYRVNPPLVHYIAAIPVLIAGYEADWRGFYDAPGAKPEFKMGEDFSRVNGERSIWLFTLARWACLPFSIVGGLFCYAWSRELWSSNAAGLLSLTLWCFEPNILAHGELITPDCAATSLGLGAAYLFWRWLRRPTWGRAGAAALVLGLAELTKMSWIVLFGLWPLLYAAYGNLKSRACTSEDGLREARSTLTRNREPLNSAGRCSVVGICPFVQLTAILAIAIYVVNVGYGFDGSFTRLKDFTFVSRMLTGLKPGLPGNRFADGWLGTLPLPVPKQYVRGIDLQKKDFEDYGQPSYLRGEWKDGGWWYYYIYGMAVKVPHGSQVMLILAAFTLAYGAWSRQRRVHGFSPPTLENGDLVVLLTPAATLFVLVSSQMEFNHHMRYVLPVLGFVYVLSGVTAYWLEQR